MFRKHQYYYISNIAKPTKQCYTHNMGLISESYYTIDPLQRHRPETQTPIQYTANDQRGKSAVA